MARRKSPIATLVIFVFVLGFGWAAYHYLVIERIFDREPEAAVPPDQVVQLRKTVDDALANEQTYAGITAFNWRAQAKRYRLDIALAEGAEVRDAKRMAGRVDELVRRSTDGFPAEVSFLVLGREIYHFVP